ncbi:unnamed protein product, partial [marine sediment metagenome]
MAKELSEKTESEKKLLEEKLKAIEAAKLQIEKQFG